MIIIALILEVKSMKKLLIIGLAFSFVTSISAQEAADKGTQFGLVLGAGFNSTRPETNLISKAGAGSDLLVGMSLDWHFMDNIALSTGLEFEFQRFKHEFNEVVFIDYRDREVLTSSNTGASDGSMLLKERRYRSIYATLPVMLKFQTNYMGYMRYFGKFGLRNSFLLQSRSDNFGDLVDASYVATASAEELLDMRVPGDRTFYRGAIGLSGGVEWNFTGGTCLVGEFGYYYGFTNLHAGDALVGDKDKNKSIYTYDSGSGDMNYRVPSASQGQFLLKVSLLF